MLESLLVALGDRFEQALELPLGRPADEQERRPLVEGDQEREPRHREDRDHDRATLRDVLDQRVLGGGDQMRLLVRGVEGQQACPVSTSPDAAAVSSGSAKVVMTGSMRPTMRSAVPTASSPHRPRGRSPSDRPPRTDPHERGCPARRPSRGRTCRGSHARGGSRRRGAAPRGERFRRGEVLILRRSADREARPPRTAAVPRRRRDSKLWEYSPKRPVRRVVV